ncbi:hypothetical protein BD309DRAFT_961564 [Dichomitus squalens]|uniref:Uncharacterized protein n=1 Tax=Dichomitus squalens TaxID=114155 RepID=A0A4Q9PHF6_9APHY|nr:hypothetical protein BD309DRAFT_961564 [Dichomitus squalens]TBU53157.1 hypothetical protein BD310DRAFT_938687 [Dichomitus squalens]
MYSWKQHEPIVVCDGSICVVAIPFGALRGSFAALAAHRGSSRSPSPRFTRNRRRRGPAETYGSSTAAHARASLLPQELKEGSLCSDSIGPVLSSPSIVQLEAAEPLVIT